jgi:hypothetical protein
MLRRLFRRLLSAPRTGHDGAGDGPERSSGVAKVAPPREAWVPGHPEAWTLEGAFHADFVAAGGDPERLVALARAVHPGLWALPVLDPTWCALHRSQVAAYRAWAARVGVEVSAPNSMNRYGLVLDSVVDGETLTPRLLDLAPLRAALAPLTARLFPEVGGGALDSHHGFVVSYTMEGDRDLSFHADDAEVTLNLCLGGGFEGGDLWFEGRRCFAHHDDAARPGEPFTWAHTPGVALLHAGAHRHGARPIRHGSRDNLILWMRAGGLRASADPALGFDGCPPWCGAHAPPGGAVPR